MRKALWHFSYNRRNHAAPFVYMAQLKLWGKIVVVAQRFLPQVGMRTSPQEISLLIAAPCAAFLKGKNSGVLALNVRRHGQRPCLLTILRTPNAARRSRI